MSYREPTPQDLQDPVWNRIWETIKGWDVHTPQMADGTRTGVTGNHVCEIYDAVYDAVMTK